MHETIFSWWQIDYFKIYIPQLNIEFQALKFLISQKSFNWKTNSSNSIYKIKGFMQVASDSYISDGEE